MNLFGVYGASGFGREVLPLVRDQLATQSEPWELVFVDDHPSTMLLNGHRVTTYLEFLAHPANQRFISIAIADSAIRERLVRRCENDGVKFFEVRASNVVQLDDVNLGEGAVLCPFVTLTSNIRIGRHFHANIYSYIAHDCVIGDYVTFAPSVKCNGNIVIEDNVYVGTGAVIKQGKPGQPLVIGRGSVIGMGAVVTKSIQPGVTVIGNPAKQLMR